MSRPADAWPSAFRARLPFVIARTSETLFAQAAADFESLALTDREYCALALLRDDAPGSQIELARLMDKTPAVVVAVVDQLEARGLMQRQRSAEDRRISQVLLTPAGEKLLTEADRRAEKVIENALPGLTVAERRTLLRLLLKSTG